MILLNACGGLGFTEDAGKNSNSKQTQTSEQPVEVSGGFGLTCDVTDHAEDSSISDFSCRLLDANGQHFQDSNNMEAVVQVKIDEQMISVTKSKRDGEIIFTFTVANDAVVKANVTTKFLNPTDNFKVLAEKSEPLSQLTQPPTFIVEYHTAYPASAQGPEFFVKIRTEIPMSPTVVRMKDGPQGFKNCDKIELINATCVTDTSYPSFQSIGSNPESETDTFNFNFKILAVGPGPISVWVDAGAVQNDAGNGNPKSNILTFQRNGTN